jgi:hypothetical protein
VKRPTHLKIAGSRWTIQWKPVVRNDRGQKLAGQCDHQASLLEVDDSESSERQRIVLLHEALHAISTWLGFKWKEKQIEEAEAVVFLLIRDNPHFIRWVLSKDAVAERTPSPPPPEV